MLIHFPFSAKIKWEINVDDQYSINFDKVPTGFLFTLLIFFLTIMMIICLCYSSAGFNPITNALSLGGTHYIALSLDACIQRCVNSATHCFSFDYNPTGDIKCFLHFSHKPFQKAQGVTHYIRVTLQSKLHKLTKS